MFDSQAHDFQSDEAITSRQWPVELQRRSEIWRLGLQNVGELRSGSFCFQREDGPILWAARASTDALSFALLDAISIATSTSPDSLRRAFADCWNNHRWARALYLNAQHEPRNPGETAHFALRLSPFGWGMWLDLQALPEPSRNYNRDKGSLFRFQSPVSNTSDFLQSASGDELLACLHDEPNRKNMAYAADFEKRSFDDLWREVWTWRNGDHLEFRRVLRWALLSQEELWRESNDLLLSLDLIAERKQDEQWQRGTLTSISEGWAHWPPPALAEAISQIMDWFHPTLRRDNVEKHLCLARFTRQTHWTLGESAHEPSAHERLEAMIEWRAWLEEREQEK